MTTATPIRERRAPARHIKLGKPGWESDAPSKDLSIPPGYKQTEVGVIPEDLDVKRLAGICERITPWETGGVEEVVEMTQTPYPRVSEWRKWDIHIHSKYSKESSAKLFLPRIFNAAEAAS